MDNFQPRHFSQVQVQGGGLVQIEAFALFLFVWYFSCYLFAWHWIGGLLAGAAAGILFLSLALYTLFGYIVAGLNVVALGWGVWKLAIYFKASSLLSWTLAALVMTGGWFILRDSMITLRYYLDQQQTLRRRQPQQQIQDELESL